MNWTLLGKFKEAPVKPDGEIHMVLCSGCKTIQKLDSKCGICSDRVAPARKAKS